MKLIESWRIYIHLALCSGSLYGPKDRFVEFNELLGLLKN